MKIEIWSDIACPFCYIGKAHLEKALANFGQENIEVTYRSYQLDPDYHHKEGDTAKSVLAHKKGMAEAQIRQMTEQITKMGEQAGVDMNFETNLPANTFDAHRLIHLATRENRQQEMLTALFKAHFTMGKNIEDKAVLKDLAIRVGLAKESVEQLLDSDDFAYAVQQDIMAARNIGVQGVPFFVFNQKYALSGAQPVSTFEDVLEKSFREWRKDNPAFEDLSTDKAAKCEDGSCEI